MASFGQMPGNNAPPPVFGGTNPTGAIPGGFSTKESFGFPNYPMFGAPNTGMVTPTANLGIFGTNTAHTGTGSSTGMQGMSSGFSSNTGSKTQLENDYGKGIGDMLYNILNGGLFNQDVANSFLNAMQPAYNRGISSIETAFGAEGARFSSAAALGIGDFSSQFNLNEQQTLASMYMQAQQEQLSLLENILPTVHAEQADSQSSGWIGDLLGSLEIVGGALTGFAPLIGMGASTIAGANSKSGGSGINPGASIPNIGMPSGNIANGAVTPSTTKSFDLDQWLLGLQDQSAGAALGGVSGSFGDSSGNPFSLPPL